MNTYVNNTDYSTIEYFKITYYSMIKYVTCCIYNK